jgi:hypothetical protein
MARFGSLIDFSRRAVLGEVGGNHRRLNFHGQLQLCLFHGAPFSGFGPFLIHFDNFGHFSRSIFHFLTFFQFRETVYVRREPSTDV